MSQPQNLLSSAATLRKRLQMRHLRLVLALAGHGTLRGAADELALTQPAATKALQELEDIVGALLFTRHARGIAPTLFGEALIRYARVVLSDLDALRDEFAAIAVGVVGKVRIGAILAPVPDLLSGTINGLKAHYPQLHISLQVDTSDVLVQALRQDALDVVVGRIPADVLAQDLAFEPLGEETLSIVAGPAHPQAGKRAVRLASLAGCPWIIQPAASPMRQIIDQAFRDARVPPPEDVIETSSIMATLPLLAASERVAVVPDAIARYFAALGALAILPVALRGRLVPYGLITRKRRASTPGMRLLADALRAACACSQPGPTPAPRRRAG
ncbi:LysR family transcriptional regulator [Cupriavidus taiwanensis]|uniref:LysR family transcriptional regulator n=1 Tax=Cupriavidus taiwanensis TaxID=164546 RepID=UPI000E181111|nr:LysR family transcriptional regulator [Cupriavidus taiwanensis]SOY70121.1 putative transcriptional regulator, LysR domain [Cupriavidus taiwanensis]